MSEPHHDGSPRYVPQQSPQLGDDVPVFLTTDPAVRSVHIRSTPDGEPRFTAAVIDRVDGHHTWWRATVPMRNPLCAYRFLLDTPEGPRWLNALGVFAHDVPDGFDFRLVAWPAPPAWAGEAVVYEIFPDRFARSGGEPGGREGGPAGGPANGLPDWAIPCAWDTPVIGRGPQTPYQLYGGDLDGIVAHLDHIEALGANAIYLTPVFPARSNHRYDAAAFDRVDPLLGGDAALARLSAAVHRRGMHLVGDLTTNHCGDSHPWFTAAAANPHSPEREMFFFDGDNYETWCGVPSLPKLNWASPRLRQRFLDGPDSVVARWLHPPLHLDGWRIDVANMTGRRGAQDVTHEVAALIRQAAAHAAPHALLVAEHAHDATGDLDRNGWHATMGYAGFTRPVWSWLRADTLDAPDFLGVPGGVPRRSAREMRASMAWFAAGVSWRTFSHGWTLLGSHDTARIRTVVGDAERVEVALGLLMTYPGVPMIFAGDEIGLTGVNGEDARRPMPWPDQGAPGSSASWDWHTLARYRALARLRREQPALRHGGLRWVHADGDALAFVREAADGERLLVYARRGPGDPVPLPGLGAVAGENLYGGAGTGMGSAGDLVLPGDGPTVQIWRLEP